MTQHHEELAEYNDTMRELQELRAEVVRLTSARQLMQLDAEKYRDEARQLRAEVERLKELVRDALDDEAALRLMPKWCEEARRALEPKP
jgi:flagellar motility protein MotE (MotC chaperone)